MRRAMADQERSGGRGRRGSPPTVAIQVRTDRERDPAARADAHAPVEPARAPAEGVSRAGPVRGVAGLLRPGGGRGDPVFRWLSTVMAIGLLGLVALLFYELFANARPLLARDGLSFVGRNDWDVPRDVFGARSLLLGTLISSLIAVVLAVPVALGIALFLTEVAPKWLRQPISSLVELLAAVP